MVVVVEIHFVGKVNIIFNNAGIMHVCRAKYSTRSGYVDHHNVSPYGCDQIYIMYPLWAHITVITHRIFIIYKN
jgi:hypothetical protein